MRITDDELMEEFRRATHCSYCGVACPQGCDPAHAYSRGAGRLDVRWNLLALCRPCHIRNHHNAITRYQVLTVIARRENVALSSIQEAIYLLRRADRGWTSNQWDNEMAGLSEEAERLVNQARAKHDRA